METGPTIPEEQIDVLLVEDDEDDMFIVRRLLAGASLVECDLTWKATYEEGLEVLLSGDYDVCLVDYRLGAHDGLELLREARAAGNHTPVILLTGRGDREVDRQAMEAGAADYLPKSDIDAQVLARSIRYARKWAESAQEIRRQAALLDEAHDGICAYDLDGEITYWNRGAARMSGRPGKDCCSLFSQESAYTDPEAIEEAWERVLREGRWEGELTQEPHKGEESIVKSRWTLIRDGAGEPQTVLVINTDITERKRLESQFLRAQRMESIGRLVSGIAHDLGNLLVPIQLGVNVLKDRFPDDDEKAQRTLAMIEKSAGRGGDMVKQVLAFARGVEGEREPLDLERVIEEVEGITEEAFPENITFEARVPGDLPQVVGDATQLQQVLVNLSVNARDAMPEGGRLTLAAEQTSIEDGDPRLTPEGEPGKYVHVSVTDTGTGIPPNVIDKVFEPFFSTKPSSEGTGLGLSSVYSIVTSHGGFVDVQSEEEVGTTFDLYLPVTEEKQGPAARAPIEHIGRGESEHVLIVDDEEFVRETAKTTLDHYGYRPLTASSAAEGLRAFDKHLVDAVVLDIAMAEMGGIEAIREFKERNPDVPILICSGLSDSEAREAMEAGADHFLAKPFDASKLCAAIEAVLSRQGEMA